MKSAFKKLIPLLAMALAYAALGLLAFWFLIVTQF